MTKSSKKSSTRSKRSGNQNISNNLAGIFFTTFFFIFLFQIPGYKSLFNDVFLKDLNIMSKYPEMSYERKSFLKNGNDFRYVDLIKKKTPNNAIVLMPSEEMIFPESKKPIFNQRTAWGIKNKAWAEYYLYPRKLIYVDELTPELLNRIEYVAIINGMGYEYLDYEVTRKTGMDVKPISQSK